MSVRHALLALLSEGPKYGLQLRQEFEAGTGDVWPLNAGQVYTTLQRLERDGLVESEDPEGEGPQKGYRLTQAGGHELDAWLRTPTDTWEPPGSRETRAMTISRWPLWSTPRSSGSRRWSDGSTPPTPASRAGPLPSGARRTRRRRPRPGSPGMPASRGCSRERTERPNHARPA